jgi:hypothetical protein
MDNTAENPASHVDGFGCQAHEVSETKAKSRHHPKPEDVTPIGAPLPNNLSSNRVRYVVRGRDMSSTDIAKFVGDTLNSLVWNGNKPYGARVAALRRGAT